jgi:hypothetical protein
MNRKEWKELCKRDCAKAHYWYNKVTKKRVSKEFESDSRTDKDAKVIHHLRDTDEQRKYNDEHYELFGFEIDENGSEHFEYGKYVVFWTKEHHNEYHRHSEETRKKISIGNKGKTLSDLHKKVLSLANKGKHLSDASRHKISKSLTGIKQSDETIAKRKESLKKAYENPELREKCSKSHKGIRCKEETKIKISEANKGKRRFGKDNPFYGKHHSDESKQKMSKSHKGQLAGKKHPFYGKHHTEESKNKMSSSLKGKPSAFKGRHHTEESITANKQKNLILKLAVKEAYNNYKKSGGTLKWNDFQKMIKNEELKHDSI